MPPTTPPALMFTSAVACCHQGFLADCMRVISSFLTALATG
jgi:hypothetical protein